MKILHVIEGMSKSSGGPSSCTNQLLRGLRSENVDVEIISFATDDPISNENYGHYIPYDGKSPLQVSRNMNRALESMIPDFDLVHTNGLWMWNEHLAAKIARKTKKPYIISTHGMLYPEAIKVSMWKKQLALPIFQRKDLECATAIHATCEDERRHLRDFGLKNPIAVIPNCLPIDLNLRIREVENPRKKFGFVGRINRYKNIHLLLEAWNRLGQITANCDLEIIGSGDSIYENELREFVSRNNLKNVHFKGFLSGESLTNAVAALDFQLLVSKSENFGMVVPEALIQGVPVIATEGTPWQELNDVQCGWWIPCDVDSIAETIKTAIELSESSRRAMGLKGCRLVERKYSTKPVARQMKTLYEWILESGATPEFVHLD